MAQKEHIHRAVHVNQKLASGLADGFSEGYATFLAHLASASPEDFDNRGADNPLLHGALLGWIEFLDRLGQGYLASVEAALQKRPNGRKKL